MSDVTYTEPAERDEFGNYHFEGWMHEDASGADRIVTVEEPAGTVLHGALIEFISRTSGRRSYTIPGPILVTTAGWWSGYSEYTVIDTWNTVVVTAPQIGWEKRWESVADLFRDLAGVQA